MSRSPDSQILTMAEKRLQELEMMVIRTSYISLISIDDSNLVPEISSPVDANVAQHVETTLNWNYKAQSTRHANVNLTGFVAW